MFKLRINGVQAILTTYRSNWVSGYSTAATTKTAATSATASKSCDLMAEYLVNSLGFSKEEATVTSSKVSNFKSTENPNSVIEFFKSSGLSETQIKNMVSRAPKILSCSVDRTLKPKIQAFQDMGFSGPDLGLILSHSPTIFSRSVDNHIIPTMKVLKSVFGNDYDGDKYANGILIAALKKSSWLLGPGSKTELPAIIALLQSYGLSVDQIKTFGLRKTRYLLLGTKVLENVLIRVEKLGIPRGSPMFIHGIIALSSVTEANLELRKGVYKSYGFTDEEVLTLARKNPYALLIAESRLKTGLNFFMKEVGYQRAEIATRPYVLTFSLKKRVIPRYTVWKFLKEKGPLVETRTRLKKSHVSLLTCLAVNEPTFFRKFVQPFEERFPNLYSDYVKAVYSVKEAAK